MELLLQLYLLAILIKGSLLCTGRILKRGVSCEEKNEIIDVHNRYRQAIALGHVDGIPPARNMLQMTWDENIAKVAQQWADQCRFQHDQRRTEKTLSSYYIGQNIAIKWWSPFEPEDGSKADWSRHIRGWFNEVYKYPYTGFFSHNIGHFTQLIWEETHLVGCGYTYYTTGNNYTKLYVCNYGPSGNIIGQRTYNEGNPECSRDNSFHSRSYYGLCEIAGDQPLIC
ncbi:hypothetical protein O3M35_000526 [Rhynocoris fuscipes]|uniref:SCP domain-containing protein n=1 Tax=Rhynocoris fuscipes TaxID=488301 RepID=A0AAW1DQH5_9HEMI